MYSEGEVAAIRAGKAARGHTVMGERPIGQIPAAPRESSFVHLCFGAVYALLHVGSNGLLWLFTSRKPRL